VEIVHIAAELAPVAKVGGLGDVLHGLSRALLQKKHHVKIILPKYDTLDVDKVEHLEVMELDLPTRFDGTIYLNTLWKGLVDGIPVILIEPHDPTGFFDRGKIYGCEDDIARFCYFCLAALSLVQKFPCDVIHIHDWHTGLIAGLLKERFPEIQAKVVYTIHNLAYQGLCRSEDLDRVGWKSAQLKEGGVYNLLKGGIVFADHVTTVSPCYAKEILTSELGGNLQPILQKHYKKFSGVLNGIDYSYWNPATDPHLPFHFSHEAPENKQKNKKELRRRLSLTDERCPLVGTVTRLVHQKGPELIKAGLLRTLEWGGQFVLLGSALDERTHMHFYNIKRKLAGSAHVHLELTYNEELSHLLYAGADLFLIPSLFEPCGLTQLIAMHYGAVPLARKTGGLADTVFEEKNGFLFGPPTAEEIHGALDRALNIWYRNPDSWQQLMLTGMKTDFSWNHPADEYLKIYTSPVLV
jgi:starch synthase